MKLNHSAKTSTSKLFLAKDEKIYGFFVDSHLMWTFAGLNYMYYVKIWLPYLSIDLKVYVHVIMFSKKYFIDPNLNSLMGK